MNKYIRNGMVAVIYSPGYGAGFSTWGAPPEAMFNPELVEAILANDKQGVERIVATYSDHTCQNTDLAVAWVPVGTRFRIHEYDGNESIVLFNEADYYTA